MTINEYVEDNILLLTASPVVDHIQIIKRRETESDGYFRARAKLLDDIKDIGYDRVLITSYLRENELHSRLLKAGVPPEKVLLKG